MAAAKRTSKEEKKQRKRAWSRQAYARDPKRVLARNERWRKRHNLAVSAQQKEYRTRKRTALLIAAKSYREINKDKLRRKDREYYERNKERVRRSHKEWRARYPDRYERAYVIKLIAADYGMRAADIPAPLIEAKRVHLKVVRLLKEMQS
jgi:hypothetical protein